jgi:hypothetical protein
LVVRNETGIGGEFGKVYHFELTMEGWTHYYALRSKRVNSRTGFMAMKFGEPNILSAFENAFRPAAEDAGFNLRLLTDDQPAGVIDDQLRAALLNARFVVADLSHGNQGAYWEAGFGEGRGIPVFYTCEESTWTTEKTHFDTNHLVTVMWDLSNLADARKRLTATIRATLRDEASL